MARLTVHVTPRASRESVVWADGAVRVRVTAPPVEGAANAAVAAALARALGLPPRDLALVTGAASRTKVFDVPLSLEEVAARLAAPER
ncbi:MAG: DUF167 domain-containing protein [Dehalococcoidia bacterium]